MTGWSKPLPAVYKLTKAAGTERWTLHRLAQDSAHRLGQAWRRLGYAELLVNHATSDELTAIYDRAEYRQQRTEAAQRWANHVTGTIKDADDKVRPLQKG